MIARILGIIRFKTQAYQEVAADLTATEQAALLVLAVSVIQAFCGALLISRTGITLNMAPGLLSAAGMVLLGVMVWVITAGILVFFGRTSFMEMLRLSGFIQVFSLLGVLRLASLWFSFTWFDKVLALAISGLSLAGYYVSLTAVAGQTPRRALFGAFLVSLLVMVVLYTLDLLAGWVASALL